jgi:RNA polymerase sigma factor FliA
VTDSVEQRVRELGPLVDRLARTFHRRLRAAVPLGDLVAFGHAGAHGAAARWDGRGRFQSFAAQRIRWAILDGLRRQERQNKRGDLRYATHLAAMNAAERAADALEPPGSAGLYADDKAAMTALLDSAAAEYALELIVAVPDIELATDDHTNIEREADRMRLRRAVGALPELERAVVERHTYAGESFDEIAELTGAKRSTVFDLYTRAVQRLRSQFAPDPSQAT